MPTDKLITDKLTTIITAAIAAAALKYFGVELEGWAILLIGGLVGWAVGGVAAYFKNETNPAPSAIRTLRRR